MNYRTWTLMILGAIFATAIAAQPTVTSVSPARNGSSESPTANLSAGFSANMQTANSNGFRVRSNLRGELSGTHGVGGTSTLTFDPSSDLLPGEQIEVALTTDLKDSTGTPMSQGHVWRYRAEAGTGPAILDRVEYNTGNNADWDAEWGDLDGDGDLDLVTVDWRLCMIHWNDGNGNFTQASSSFGAADDGSYGCAIADMNGDGHLDIIVANSPGSTSTGPVYGQNKVFLNDGSGGFTNSVNFGASDSRTIDLDVGDVDGDGDMDIVTANGAISNEANFIYINDGNANFTARNFLYVPNSTAAVTDNSWAIRLADFNNDGALDCVVGNFGFTGAVASYLYFNDGNGNFSMQDSTTYVSSSSIICITVADFDDDGDVDIATGTLQGYGKYFYWNNGSGSFSSQIWGGTGNDVWALEPGDVDGDGDLDLAVGLENGQGYVYLNTGSGTFNGTKNLGNGSTTMHNIAFADCDCDGDLDAGTPGRVCFNGTNPPTFNVQVNSNWITDGANINVNYNDTVNSLGIMANISDPDSDDVSVSTQITNTTTQGFVLSEWQSSQAATPYNITPSSGTFNQGSTTHKVTFTAQDAGGETSTFTFYIVVGSSPNSPPTVAVVANSAMVSNGGNISVPYGTTLASLNMSIVVDDPDNDSVSLTGTVTNKNSTGLTDGEFSSAAATTSYTLSPSIGTFNSGSTTHTVSMTAADGNGGNSAFTFDIVVGPAPAAQIAVYENSVGGTVINHGASASGGRDFGSRDINSGPTNALTVVIDNPGTADLTVGGVSLTGTNAGDFVLDTTNLAGTVTAGTNTSFTVAFDPVTAGSKSATVSITHSATGVSSPFTFAITGVGTSPAPAPIIVVREGSATGTQVNNGATAGGSRNFGSLLVGDTSAPVTIIIQNAGNADLTLGVPSITGPAAFSLDTSNYAGTVPAGTSTSFNITFAPTAEGNFSGTVTFTHNDTSTSSPFTFEISGSASASVSTGGSTGGSGGGASGGGCVVGEGNTSAMLIALVLLGGIAAVLTRRKRC